MTENTSELANALLKAANRLHHLSMRYVGSLIEMVTGNPLLTVTKNRIGVAECRDFIDLTLYNKSEANALARILLEKGIMTQEEWQKAVVEEYNWLTEQKAKQFGVTVTDTGLMFPGTYAPTGKK